MASVIGRGYNGRVSYTGGSNTVGSNQIHVTPPDKNGVQHTIVKNSPANQYASSIGNLVGRSDTFNQLYNEVLDTKARNNAIAQANAERQMEYQTMSDRFAMNWSAQEAAKNREWQEELSNSAHQREVQDLLKAGLNPILSAGGQGASTPTGAVGAGFTSSGAMAQNDMTQPSEIMAAYFADILNSANIQAQIAANKEIIANNNATSRYVSDNALRSGLANAGAIVTSANTQAATNKEQGELNREFQRMENQLERDHQREKTQMETASAEKVAHINNLKTTTGAAAETVGFIYDALSGKFDSENPNRENIDPNEWIMP